MYSSFQSTQSFLVSTFHLIHPIYYLIHIPFIEHTNFISCIVFSASVQLLYVRLCHDIMIPSPANHASARDTVLFLPLGLHSLFSISGSFYWDNILVTFTPVVHSSSAISLPLPTPRYHTSACSSFLSTLTWASLSLKQQTSHLFPDRTTRPVVLL
jgi:hypothetical protein